MRWSHTYVWLLLGLGCLIVGDCVAKAGRGGGGRGSIGGRGSSGGRGGGRGSGGGKGGLFSSWWGSSSSSSGKVSSNKISSSTIHKPSAPPGFHSRPAGAPPPYPGLPGHAPSYPGGPPPPYPGLGHGNYGPPPPYPGLSHGNHAPPPYPGLGHGNHAPPPPYPGHGSYPAQGSYSGQGTYPGGYQKGYSGTDFVSGMLVGHSLSSLSRDRSYHHYYYPHNFVHRSHRPDSLDAVETTDEFGINSFTTYSGNTTCVTSYNGERVSDWANEVLKEFYRKYPEQQLLDLNSNKLGLDISDIITKSKNFTVVQGDIIRNESMTVTCCGVKEITNLNRLIAGQVPGTNCVHQQYVIPLKKLTFVPITTSTESTATSTENIETSSSTTSTEKVLFDRSSSSEKTETSSSNSTSTDSSFSTTESNKLSRYITQ